MQMHIFRLRIFAFVAGLAMLVFSGAVSADPPSRVGRLGYVSGVVSFSPAGEDQWGRATLNRPLTTGDRLWTDARGRAEIQVGGAMIRMMAGTGVSVLNLDERIVQLELTQGTLNVRVRRLEPDQVFEVDTPNLAFSLRQPGEYRITVDPDGGATTVIVRKGRGEVYGENASYIVDARQPYRFIGAGLRQYQAIAAPRLDEFDNWSSARDRSYDNSRSARYVSSDVVGYQDLDANGIWRTDPRYGNVWVPNRVASGWAPYRDGHWAWVDPWGWTWVDDAPWGYAVSHYGRWADLNGSWAWVPGPVRSRAYYAPALVAFVGGNNFQLTLSSGNVGGIAWFPLAPREVYRPSYQVSRGYFENINQSNTVINTTVINNYYNNTNVTNVVYANRQVPGAVVAVPATAFVQSQPVARAAVRVSREMIASAPVAHVPALAPTEKSVRGAAAQGGKPPGHMFDRAVIARTAPSAAPAGFAAQQKHLIAKPGKPLDDTERKEVKHAAAVPAPAVKLLAPAQITAPIALPPPAAANRADNAGRGKPKDRPDPAARVISKPVEPRPQVAAPAENPRRIAPEPPPQQAPKPEARERKEQQVQPVAPSPSAVPTARPQQQEQQQQRGKSESRGNAEPRERLAAPAEALPPRAAPLPQTAPLAPQAIPNAEQHREGPAPSAGKPKHRQKDDEKERDEEKHKKK